MRINLFRPFFAVVIVLLASFAEAAEFVPYRAAIVTPSAVVRSGPGDSFYETDTLAESDVVEVYRQQANGWCAIRPPEGSFSWVFGRHLGTAETVALSDQSAGSMSARVARVEKPDVASRIGSRLTAQRNAVQVRLKQGETVRILGEEEIDGQTWFKIAPPAGEFRWIHVSAIRSVGPIPAAGPDRAEEPAPVVPALANDAAAADSTGVSMVGAAGGDAPPSTSATNDARYPDLAATPSSDAAAAVAPQLLTQQQPLSANPVSTPEPVAVGNSWRAALQPVPPAIPAAAVPGAQTPLSAPTPQAVTPTTSTPPPITPITGESGNAKPAGTHAELELRLSRAVAEPPAAWNMESLRADAQALIAAAPVAEKPAIHATIAKIDRFASIGQRYRASNGTSAESLVAPDGTRFDAVGVLRPVNSRRPGAPPFALVDERGQVLSFITPTAGMNLQPLVGQRIGVMGNRGYIPEFQRAHVVAGRALPVSERMVR
jgi:hypothetical protein